MSEGGPPTGGESPLLDDPPAEEKFFHHRDVVESESESSELDDEAESSERKAQDENAIEINLAYLAAGLEDVVDVDDIKELVDVPNIRELHRVAMQLYDFFEHLLDESDRDLVLPVVFLSLHFPDIFPICYHDDDFLSDSDDVDEVSESELPDPDEHANGLFFSFSFPVVLCCLFSAQLCFFPFRFPPSFQLLNSTNNFGFRLIEIFADRDPQLASSKFCIILIPS
jgi:hypothetical protein